jgi:hypothetical protein
MNLPLAGAACDDAVMFLLSGNRRMTAGIVITREGSGISARSSAKRSALSSRDSRRRLSPHQQFALLQFGLAFTAACTRTVFRWALHSDWRSRSRPNHSRPRAKRRRSDFGESEMDALRAKLAAEEIPAREIPRTMIGTSMIRRGIICTTKRLKHEQTVDTMAPPLWLQAQPMLRYIAECRGAFV